MALKTYNPTSPGRRHLIQVDKSTLWKGKPVKTLVEGKTKTEIKAAIESLFKVKVKAVNTIVRKGKKRAFRGITAVLSDTKRAVVTLEDGHSIDVTTGL